MDLYYFISSRINKGKKGSFSSTVSTIAVISISVGLVVMILSFAILEGFRNKIQNKIFSLGAHVQISTNSRMGYSESPISLHRDLYKLSDSIKEIDHIQGVIHNLGLMKKKSTEEDEFTGAIFKGVGADFDTVRFAPNIVEGRFIRFRKDTVEEFDGKKEIISRWSDEVIISRKIANKLKISLGDKLFMVFLKKDQIRPLVVRGIYETGLEEFDELMIIGDRKMNQGLNQWGDSLVGGYEIFLKDFAKFEDGYEAIHYAMDSDMFIDTIKDKYIQIFDWLKLLDQNVIIFLVIILFIACFNMVSTLFIMIMERTNMIGVLKALGATNRQIQTIFYYNGLILILKGMVIGNVVGLGLCFLQYKFKLIPLDPQNYYMNTVPIEWNWVYFGALNALTILVVGIVLIIPIIVISNIKPIKSIKFD